jgi:saccharopine dehydrogenase (NAD+, L-lysine-forming)
MAPESAIIIGLKEFRDTDSFPLIHEHILFAHCFKNQRGWQQTLLRFQNGGGKLYDLEYLVNNRGRRVAAFGYQAGFAGAAVGLDVWACPTPEQYPQIVPFASENALVSHVQSALSFHSKLPKVLVIGAKGRCGTGAVDFLRRCGLPERNIIEWDLPETAKGGPFPAIALDFDLFINCIYLESVIPPFLTSKELELVDHRIKVIVDVSCDPNNPNNPIPIYSTTTTFEHPTLQVASNPPVFIIAIDHLPSLLPRESSDRFSCDLLPTLLQLPQRRTSSTWKNAEDLFFQKLESLHH